MNIKKIFDISVVRNWIKFSNTQVNFDGLTSIRKNTLKAQSISCIVVDKVYKDGSFVCVRLVIAIKGSIKQTHEFDSFNEALEFCDIWIDIIGDDSIVEYIDKNSGKHVFFNKDGTNQIINKKSSDGKYFNLIVLVDALDNTNNRLGFTQHVLFDTEESADLFSNEFLV